MQNLILGVINKLSFPDLRVFFNSLKETGYNGHVCIFAGPGSGRRTLQLLERYSVEVIRFEPQFPYIKQAHADNVKFLSLPESLFQYRHFLYYDYLLKNRDRFDKVMITDVRDVAFQKDPFGFDMEGSICIAMETRRFRIADDRTNCYWIRLGYGEEVLQQYKSNIISCAGTTFAPLELMLKYLHEMLLQIQSHGSAHITDQGMHNILVNSGRLSPLKKLYNPDGIVLSLCTSNEYTIREGRVFSIDGYEAKVIHQYDRHRELVHFFNKKYYYDNRMRRCIDRMHFKISP